MTSQELVDEVLLTYEKLKAVADPSQVPNLMYLAWQIVERSHAPEPDWMYTAAAQASA